MILVSSHYDIEITPVVKTVGKNEKSIMLPHVILALIRQSCQDSGLADLAKGHPSRSVKLDSGF